ncbi:MAG: RecQ family ATP-dependent DNA helicase, partial [Longimicrobiales bacterium]
RSRVLRQARDGDLQVLFLAPERLLTPAFAPVLGSGRVARVAVDEAHCLIQWGFDFRPAYLSLAGIGHRLRCPVLAVTATATPRVREAIESVLGLRAPVRVQGSFDRPNLAWRVRRVRGEADRWTALRSALRAPGAALVYAPTRRSVEAVRDALARRGLAAEAYHAGLAPAERMRVQDRFLEGRVRVVVATNAFGMGVDKADVRQVIHWAPPGSIEAWYQEAGRAGRDGAPARCLVLWRPDDLRLQARLASSPARDRDDAEPVRSGPEERRWRRASRMRLRALGRFLRGRGCRRRAALAYLGEPDPPSRCSACDRCAPDGRPVPLSAVSAAVP